ncbi:MAG TPA: hypothetical protein VHO26_03605 [Propionibacteriaceae bacterium]|nr:hypothetical protein [Propionibacteriaceae bacterium]
MEEPRSPSQQEAYERSLPPCRQCGGRLAVVWDSSPVYNDGPFPPPGYARFSSLKCTNPACGFTGTRP